MAQTRKKYQIIQKTSSEDTVLLHPETEAGVVEFSNSASGLSANNVQDAIDELSKNTGVTGVKGNKESGFREGNVNLSPSDIGAEPEGTVDTHNKSVSAHSDIRQSVSKAQSRADDAYALAEGKSNGSSYENISEFVKGFNALDNTKHNLGDNVYIQTLGVPDLWVYSVEETSVAYEYVSDEKFIADINKAGQVQVGYYKVSKLETEKVDLSGYQTKQDESLLTTSKAVVGAINEVKGTADKASSKATTNESNITKIVNGTTVVGKASASDTATSATTATKADKLTTGRKLTVAVNSGKKADGSSDISGDSNQTFDGSADKTISVVLGDSGVSAGTYSALQVNAKGVAVSGGQILEVGNAGQSTPSTNLAIGGLFFKVI